MLQLINERDNIPLKNLITNIHRMTRQFQNKGTNIQEDGTLAWLWIRNFFKFNKEEKKKEMERIKQRFPVAPSYKKRNLTDDHHKVRIQQRIQKYSQSANLNIQPKLSN